MHIMAETPDLPKTLEEMAQEITCAVCHEHYREPKILPCFHYFCTECLQRLAERVGQPVPCPECRRQATFPQNDARKLPTPFFVNRMIEFYSRIEKKEGKKEAICELCSGGKAEAFCRQCTAFVCTKCVESHDRMTTFHDHEVTSMDQLRVGGARQISTPPKRCKMHDEVLKLFCYTCNQLICRDCIIYDHTEPDHKHTFVKEAAGQYREELRESVAPLRQATTKIAAAITDVQTAQMQVDDNLATVSTTIERSIDEMIATLQQRKQALLAETSALSEKKRRVLNAQEKSLSISLAEAQSLLDFVDRSVQNASDGELLLMQQQMKSGVEEGCTKKQLVGLKPAATANVITNMTHDKQPLLTVGCVGLDVIDASKCTMRETDTKAEVNKPVELALQLIDSNGRVYAGCQSDSIVAEVKSLVDDSVTPATVTPDGRYYGTCRIVYTPSIRGRHSVTVTVNGRGIGDSPFSVFVRIPPAQLEKPVRVIKGLNKPHGIAINKNGEVLVAERVGNRVSVFDTQGQKLRTIQHSDLSEPIGVAVDSEGNIYVSNFFKVVKFSRDGQLLQINNKLCLYLHLLQVVDRSLYVCSDRHRLQLMACDDLHVIRDSAEFSKFDIPQQVLSGPPNGPEQALCVNGELYVSDCGHCCIQVFDQEKWTIKRSFPVKDPTARYEPRGISVGPDGLLYIVGDCVPNTSSLLVFTLMGEFVASLGQLQLQWFGWSRGVAVDADGFVYVCFIPHLEEGCVLVF